MSDETTGHILALLERMDGRLDRLDARLDRLEAGQARLEDRMARLEERQTRLEDRQMLLEERQTGLEDRLARLETAQVALEGTVLKVADRLDRLEVGQNRLRADLMGRAERLQDALTTLREDITVGFGTANQAQLTARNLRESVIGLGTRIEGVSEEADGLRRLIGDVMRRVDRLQSEVNTLRDRDAPSAH